MTVLCVAALLAYVVAYVRWPALASQVDLQVYRFGALRVVSGQDLYSIGLTGNTKTLLFDYTPFAALCSLPLTLLNTVTTQVLGLIGNLLLVGYVVHRCLRWLGMTAATGLWRLTALLMALICLFVITLIQRWGSRHERSAGAGAGGFGVGGAPGNLSGLPFDPAVSSLGEKLPDDNEDERE